MKITPFLDRVESENNELNKQFIENHVFTIIKLAISEIGKNQNGQQYHATEITRRLEDEIDVIVKAVLAGESSLDELRSACAAWAEAAKPAPVIVAELFEGEK